MKRLYRLGVVKKLNPNYPAADTSLCNVLGEVHGFLSYSNFVLEQWLTHHNISTKHSVIAAEELVKGLLSTRGIDFNNSHDLMALSARFRFLCAEDPISEELLEFAGNVPTVHAATHQEIYKPVEPIDQTIKRMRRVLLLLPNLTQESFDHRKPSEELKQLLAIRVSNNQVYVDHLTDSEIRKIVQQALDRIHYYLH